jgi:hypothetical protein
VTPIADQGREAIQRLRDRTQARATPITLDQVATVVAKVQEGNCSLDAMSAAAKLTSDQVIGIIVDLGTWLGQSIKAGAGAIVSEHDEAPGPVEGTGAGSQSRAHTDDYVVLPPGFERALVGRDLSKAVSQIVRADPSEPMLRRWLMRRYHHIHQILDFGVVASVHRICQIGRLGEIDQLADRNGEFQAELARVLYEAYDLLDFARDDACKAVMRLTEKVGTPLLGDTTLTAVARDLHQASWLQEAAFMRLRRLIDEAKQSGSQSRLEIGLAQLRRAATLDPVTYLPTAVAMLNDGQVRRLAEREGLRITGTDHQEADTVRNWVAAAGMTSDADLLVPAGIQALQAGLGDTFCDALERRSEGDLDWADELNGALVEIPVL